MKSSFSPLRVGLIMLTLTVVAAIAGYLAAGWDVADAVYMVAITIFGIGYDEVRPIDSAGLKAFTILVIVSGTSSVIYIMSGVIHLMMQGEIQNALGARRMTRGIDTQKNHVIICGYGRLGQILARDLRGGKAPFVIIDADLERTKEADAAGFLVAHGNANEEEVLRRAGIGRAAYLATVLPSDADNVFITLTARTLNKDLTIISRGEQPSTEAKLRQAGANHVILPPAIGGSKIAELILNPAGATLQEHMASERTFAEELDDLGVAFSEIEIDGESKVAGCSLAGLDARGRENFIVVGIRKASGEMIYTPNPALILAQGDTVVLIGKKGDTAELRPREKS